MKKAFVFLLIITLLFSSVACGQKPIQGSESSTSSQISSVTAEVIPSSSSEPESVEISHAEQSILSSSDTTTDESIAESVAPTSFLQSSSFSDNSQNSVASHVIPTWEKADPDDVTSEVMQNALEEFHAFIDSLCVENIGKIWVGISDPGGSQSEYATDPKMIERWLEMFRSIEIERVVPYELTYGGHTDFTIYDKEGNIYESFGFAPSKVRYDDSYLTNLVVKEMDEDLLISLLKEMGFKSMYVQGYGYW